MLHKPLTSVLVKPLGSLCNLKCKYCFYLDNEEANCVGANGKMSLELVEQMISQLMQYSQKHISLIWQGGEPTLMGLDFYRNVIELELKYGKGKVVGNGLQTNGILLDDEWMPFLKKYNWLLGLSLDGPRHIHDYYRLNVAGEGTHQKVENNAIQLLKNGISTNVTCTVNNYSVNYPEALYQYYKQLGLVYMQFIPIVESLNEAAESILDFSVDAKKYGEFLCRLFDLWLADFKNGRPTTSIRFFETVFHTYMEMPVFECTMMKECGAYVVIEHNGNVYSCDFYVDEDHRLGNITTDNILELLNSPGQLSFGKEKNKLPEECHQCPWLSKCYGGCTRHQLKDKTGNSKPYLCESFKQFYAYADARFKQIAANWPR